MSSSADTVVPTSGSSAFWRHGLTLLFPLTIVGVVAATRLFMPLGADQSVFAVFARMMNEGGAVLYRDVWDVKQPGIYMFYQLAGTLFGFGEAGIHLLEFLVLLSGAIIGYFALRRRLSRPGLATLFPLFSVGWYYFLSRYYDMTEVEGLVGPLLLGCMLLSVPNDDGDPPARSRLFVAGLIAGVLGWFKLLILIVPVSMWLTAAFLVVRDEPSRRRRLQRAGAYLIPVALGAALPLIGLLVWVSALGVLETAWYTWVFYPFDVLGHRPMGRLYQVAFRALVIYGPVLLIVAVVAFGRSRLRSTTFKVNLAWLFGAGVVVLLQTWWPYQLLLAMFPAAWLAIEAIDHMGKRRPRVRVLIAAALLAAATPAIWGGAQYLTRASVNGYGWDPERRVDHQVHMSPDYGGAIAALEAIEIGDRDTLHTVGETVVMYLSGRPQALRVQGMQIDQSETTLDWTIEDIEELRPNLLFISSNFGQVTDPTPDFIPLLNRLYRPAWSSPYGDWYRLRQVES